MKSVKRQDSSVGMKVAPVEVPDSEGPDSPQDEHEMERSADLEARLATLAGRVVELEVELRTAQETLLAHEHEREVGSVIAASNAADAETVRVLLQKDLADNPGQSVSEALAQLRDRKPLLFVRAAPAGSAMAARAPDRADEARISAARKMAAHDGDRASLLKYLRLRREGM